MLKEPNLPESLIPGCLDILCKISNNERDFIRVVVEDVITDLREGEVEEDTEVCRHVIYSRKHANRQNMDSHASTYSTTPARRKGSSQRALADDPDARLKAALTDLRCLMICISLLERVNSVRLLTIPAKMLALINRPCRTTLSFTDCYPT
jgi:condensin complex subunit 3